MRWYIAIFIGLMFINSCKKRNSNPSEVRAASQSRFAIEEVGGVTIATFLDRKIDDENSIQMIGNEMFNLVDEDGRKRIILDFANVEYLSSDAFGKLITMNNKVKAAKGKLILCNINPDNLEAFKITKINKQLDIKPNRQLALAEMQ